MGVSVFATKVLGEVEACRAVFLGWVVRNTNISVR